MITPEIYIFLGAVVAGAFVYIFLDLENRLYGNLFAAGFAAIISGLLSLWSFNENVQHITAVVSESIEAQNYVNDTLQNVTVTNAYTVFASPIVDPALGYLWLFAAAFFAFMFAYFVFEILQESKEPEREEEYE